MKNFYIVLSRSHTIFAIIIRCFTRKYYNHTSVAFDKSLDEFYSFGRRNPRFMFPAGFITEGAHKGFFQIHPKTKIRVLEGELTQEQYEIVMEKLTPFKENPKKYKYGLIQAVMMVLNIPYHSDTHYVCSVFAAYLFKDIFDFGKDYSLVFPEDFCKLGLNKIYEGRTGDYRYEKQ